MPNPITRSEQEILDLVLGTAHQDERIRAVVMNGSRANPNAPRDCFQDYDIVYYVTDLSPYIRNLEWIRRFGEMMILQLPDDMTDPPPGEQQGYTYLMQFLDGNRIDLNIRPLSATGEPIEDSLFVVLLDKDRCFANVPTPSEAGYLPTPPTAKNFADCCNEFWWVNPYVAKGLWRHEILYARYMLDVVVRAELMKMLAWYIGTQTGFQANPGKFGKYYEHYLSPELWSLLQQTYAPASYQESWQALFKMGELFRIVANAVAGVFDFDYPMDDDRRVSAHLRHVQQLPPGAKSIY